MSTDSTAVVILYEDKSKTLNNTVHYYRNTYIKEVDKILGAIT